MPWFVAALYTTHMQAFRASSTGDRQTTFVQVEVKTDRVSMRCTRSALLKSLRHADFQRSLALTFGTSWMFGAPALGLILRQVRIALWSYRTGHWHGLQQMKDIRMVHGGFKREFNRPPTCSELDS